MSAIHSYNISPNPDDDNLFSVPTGAINLWSTATAPQGWLLCNGNAYSRTLYADLFSVIGTTYGSGDQTVSFTSNTTNAGSTTQNITGGMTSTTAFAPGKTFTMTGGPTNYNLYVFTVVSTTSTSVTATATQSGSPVIFSVGTSIITGTVTSSAGTTFNVPNTSGRTIRGVGQATGAGSPSVALAAATGTDSIQLAAANVPSHQHNTSSTFANFLTDNSIGTASVMIGNGGTQSYTLRGGQTASIYDGTATPSIVTAANASGAAFSLVNQYLGLNYIIKS